VVRLEQPLRQPRAADPLHGVPVAAGHRLAGDERVHDRLLGRLDHGVEEPVHPIGRERGHRHGRRALDGVVDERAQAAVAGREGQDDVARGVLAGAADAADAERGPLSKPVALAGEERGVRGDDDDDRAARARAGAGRRLLAGELPDRDAVHPEPIAAAVVGLDEHAHGRSGDDPRGSADPALEPVAHHPGAAADPALRHRAGARRGQRGMDVLGAHVHPVDVAQVAVVGLADDRQVPALLVRRDRGRGSGDQRVADDADGVGVREPDDGGQEPGLADPLEAGQLAVSVQAVAAGEGGLGPGVVGAGDDHRDAGPHRPAADDERAVDLDQRSVADADACDVGDRVRRSGRQAADDDREVAGALSGRRYVRPPSWRGRPSSGMGSQTAAVPT
jgi:hypothetical protein